MNKKNLSVYDLKNLTILNLENLNKLLITNKKLIIKNDYFKTLLEQISEKKPKEQYALDPNEPLMFEKTIFKFYKQLIHCFQDKLNFFNHNYVYFADKENLFFFSCDIREINFLQDLSAYRMLYIIKNSGLSSKKFAQIFFIFLAISKKKNVNGKWLVNVESFKNNVENQFLIILFSKFLGFDENLKKPTFEATAGDFNGVISSKFIKSLDVLSTKPTEGNKKYPGGYGFMGSVEKFLVDAKIITEIISCPKGKKGCYYYVVNQNLNNFFLEFSK